MFSSPTCTQILVLVGQERLHRSQACGAGCPSSGSWRSYTTTLMTYQHFTHTFSPPEQLYKPFGRLCNTPKKSTVHRAVGSRPLGGHQRPQTCTQLALRSPLHFFPLPPDLKIAGNSIFILLSKNFFLGNTAPLPNSRTSRGAPAPSSRSFWAAAVMGK